MTRRTHATIDPTLDAVVTREAERKRRIRSAETLPPPFSPLCPDCWGSARVHQPWCVRNEP